MHDSIQMLLFRYVKQPFQDVSQSFSNDLEPIYFKSLISHRFLIKSNMKILNVWQFFRVSLSRFIRGSMLSISLTLYIQVLFKGTRDTQWYQATTKCELYS